MKVCEARAVVADGFRTAPGGHEPVVPVELRLFEGRRRHPAEPWRRREHRHTPDPLRPADCHRLGGVRAPVMSCDHEPVDPEPIHQRDHVHRQDRGVARPRPIPHEPRGAKATQHRCDRPQPRGVERRHDIVPGRCVVGPAVDQQHRGAVARPCIGVGNLEIVSRQDRHDGPREWRVRPEQGVASAKVRRFKQSVPIAVPVAESMIVSLRRRPDPRIRHSLPLPCRRGARSAAMRS
jgi:hypothetical protein